MRPNPSYRKADHLASPEIFEPIGCQLRVSNGVLNIPVSKVVLQRASIVAIIGEFVAASMAQHVRMDWEWHLGGFPEALDKPMEADWAHWSTPLRNEYIGVCEVFAPKLA